MFIIDISTLCISFENEGGPKSQTVAGQFPKRIEINLRNAKKQKKFLHSTNIRPWVILISKRVIQMAKEANP